MQSALYGDSSSILHSSGSAAASRSAGVASLSFPCCAVHKLRSARGSAGQPTRCTIVLVHTCPPLPAAFGHSLTGCCALRPSRYNVWVNQQPSRGQHVMQAAVGVNMVAAIFFFSQVQRWRLGTYDSRIDDLSVTDPALWRQYETEIRDSIRISELREDELRAEAEQRTAVGLPPHDTAANQGRVVRRYNIDGRERVVTFVNTNPLEFREKQKEWRERRERAAAQQGRAERASSEDDCCALPVHARINDGKTPAPTHPITQTRGGGLVPTP